MDTRNTEGLPEMICPTCRGTKIIEIMGGVITKRCDTCKGKGEVEDEPESGIVDRVEPDNQNARSGNTGVTRKKRRAGKATPKRIS